MPNEITYLFALLDNKEKHIKEKRIRRIALTAPLQRKVGKFFLYQQQAFIANKEPEKFVGGFNVDDGRIFQIENYLLPESILNVQTTKVDFLNLEDEISSIIALFVVTETGQDRIINFQVFDTSRTLSNRGFTIIYTDDVYQKLEKPGLILQNKLTAHFSGGNLLFLSYYNTKRFLDLSKYYKEATNDDLESFAKNKLFKVENVDTFKETADNIVRKHVGLLKQNAVLDKLSVNKIREVANKLNEQVSDEHKIHLNINNNGEIVIPEDKKELKHLIRFLCEDYVTAPLTQRIFLTNSKKHIPK